MNILKDNSAAAPYIDELKTIRPQMEAFVILADDESIEFSEDEFSHWQALTQRVGELADILEAIETAVFDMRGTPPAERVDVQALAGKSTLELMNAAARHLAGRDVIVTIQEPRPGAIGETFYDDAALKIAISPRAVADGDRYLNVLLHEIAHAKLHMAADCSAPAWKMEEEAKQQADYWTHYAKKNLNPMQYAGEGTPAARQFRAKLITLIASQEAAETIGTY